MTGSLSGDSTLTLGKSAPFLPHERAKMPHDCPRFHVMSTDSHNRHSLFWVKGLQLFFELILPGATFHLTSTIEFGQATVVQRTVAWFFIVIALTKSAGCGFLWKKRRGNRDSLKPCFRPVFAPFFLCFSLPPGYPVQGRFCLLSTSYAKSLDRRYSFGTTTPPFDRI